MKAARLGCCSLYFPSISLTKRSGQKTTIFKNYSYIRGGGHFLPKTSRNAIKHVINEGGGHVWSFLDAMIAKRFLRHYLGNMERWPPSAPHTPSSLSIFLIFFDFHLLPYHSGIVKMFYSLRFIAGLPQSLPQTTTPASKSLREYIIMYIITSLYIIIAGLPQSLPQTTTPASKSLRATWNAVF